MFLVELVLQGIRGFQKLMRVRFQGGFNFVAAGNEGGKTTSVDAALRLLFPANLPAGMESLVSRATPDASRGALVVYSDDSSYYRVIQDFSKRAVNLSRYNPGTKEFTLLHKDWETTAQFMAGLMPGISEDDFERLFIFRRDRCSGRGAPASGHAAASAARASVSPGRTSGNERRLAELRETLRKAEEAADAEYKVDAAKLQLAEIEKKLAGIEEGLTRAEGLEAQIADLKVCEMLPENLSELISAREQEESEKAVKLDDLDQDIESLSIQRDAIPQVNILTDKLFLSGLVVVVLSVVAGLFFLSAEQAVFLPIGFLGGVLLLAAGWYNGSRKNAQRREVQKDIDGLIKERAEVEKKFQESGATILKCMQSTGSQTTAELKEKADNYRYFQELYRDIQEQQRMTLGGKDAAELQAEHAKQAAVVEELAAAARAVAHNAVDTYSVRQEIDRIESESAPGSPVFGFGGAGEEAPAPAAAPPGGAGLNVLADIAVASRTSGIEMETLVPAVESAAQRNLLTMSGGRYVKVDVGPDGLPVVHDRGGATLAYASLSHGTREMICFCFSAGLIEAIAGKRRLPFILDDPFTGLDPGKQLAACQILRTLGTKTQVILLTSNPALKASNDAAAELK